MTTITARLPRRTQSFSARIEPLAGRYQRTADQLRNWNENLNGDHHASVSEMTLRSHSASRFH